MRLVKLYRVFLILLLIGANQLFALTEVETNYSLNMQDRDYSLHNFENETAISYWYGAETWAVKFVAKEFLVTANSMTVNAVNIYFPTIPQTPVTVRGFTYTEDSHFDPLYGEPIPELNIANIQITETGWHRIDLTSAYSGEGIWVIVDNETSFQNKYMASAQGSGKNSYYKVVGSNTVYFRRFYDLNISQELLFTVDGYIESENEFDDFKIIATSLEHSYEDFWEYNYSIRNFLNEQVNDAELSIEVIHPNPEVYSAPIITQYIDLAPLADNSMSGGTPLNIRLPIQDSQYKIITTLRRDSSADESFTNTIRVSNFTRDDDTAIIMNFISGNNLITPQVLLSQHPLMQPNWYIFNLGIDGSDPLFYSNYAYNYYVSFGVNLTPLTIINGTTYFNSFNVATMEQNLNNNVYYFPKILDTIEENVIDEENNVLIYHTTFNYGERFLFDTFAENLAVDVFISQKTKHYSEASDEFVVGEITEINADFLRLNEGGNGFFSFAYDTDNIDSLYTTSNGIKYANAIIYHTDTNEIVSFRRFPLEDNILVSNQNHEVQEVSTISTYPNPCYAGEALHLLTETKDNYDAITLYNIRGQKVGHFPNINNKIKVPEQLANGVYFMKATTQAGKSSKLKKILILRRNN